MLPREHLAYLENTLPYTSKELIALESSLLNWIYKCGAIKNYKKQPTSFLEIEDDLMNGTIYCKLVEFIFGAKLKGIFKDPRTESTKVSNLRKALEVLKKEKSMSQKYTWSEREISKGNRECMIGLLEDMHILFDGYPPRQCGKNYFENGPHIGKVYDQMTRKPFYYHKDEDTCKPEIEYESENSKTKGGVKDFIGEAKKTSSKDFKITKNGYRNTSIPVNNHDSESSSNLRLNTSQEAEKGLNTDRPYRKHENVPSIINNQMGNDICSPIAKVTEKVQYEVSPKRKEADNQNEVYRTFVSSTEYPMSAVRSNEGIRRQNSKDRTHEMNSKAESNFASPDSHTFLPQKRITEESMDYTERSRSEELEELEGSKQAAQENYANQKSL